MKKVYLTCTLALLTAALSALPMTHLQAELGPDEQGGLRRKFMEKRGEHMREFIESLQLTDAQKQNIRPLFEKHKKEMQALKEDSSLAPEQKREKFKAMQESFYNELDRYLTADQRDKLAKHRAEKKKKMEEWREKHEKMKAEKEGQTSQPAPAPAQ